MYRACLVLHVAKALINPEMSFLIHHPHTGNLNTETSGDSQNAFCMLWSYFSTLGREDTDLHPDPAS